MALITSIQQLRRTFNIPANVVNAKGNPYDSKINQTVTKDKKLYESTLGTPVVADITFKGGTYIDSNDKLITFRDVTFYTVLLTVSQAKKIVKTEIQGRDGTVKEYIGMDDYAVTINGIINGPNGHYPTDEVRELKDMLDAPISIAVVSRYLQNLDIHNLVIEDYTLDQEAGGYSKQDFTIDAVSDMPVEFIINNV